MTANICEGNPVLKPESTNRKLAIWAISFAFPPFASPRSIQVSRLLKSLAASVSVICADEIGGRVDPTIDPDSEEHLEKSIRIPFSPQKFSGWKARVWSLLSRPVRSYQNTTPDRYKAWQKPTIATIVDLWESARDKPDAIVTFAQPFTDHLIGKEIKRIFGIPWIAHFSDPWVDNPFADLNVLTRAKNRNFENEVVHKADLVIFTSAETCDLVMAKYGAELKRKARVLPHCFEPDRYVRAKPSAERSEIVIRHLGEFYGPRSPRPLLQALVDIYKSTPKVLDNVRFELIGKMENVSEADVTKQLPSGLVATLDPVSYQESLDMMADADGLLLIDAPTDHSVFLPSKLIDYIGSGRPILGITPPGSAHNLITELGGLTADPREIEVVGKQLVEFIRLLQYFRHRNVSDIWGTPSVRARYEAAKTASKFLNMVEEILSMG